MVTRDVHPGRRDKCTQTPEKLERFKEKLAGAVGERPLNPVAQPAILAAGQALERKRRTQAVAAQPLEAFAVVLVNGHIGS